MIIIDFLIYLFHNIMFTFVGYKNWSCEVYINNKLKNIRIKNPIIHRMSVKDPYNLVIRTKYIYMNRKEFSFRKRTGMTKFLIIDWIIS